jgi:hypothetical protein
MKGKRTFLGTIISLMLLQINNIEESGIKIGKSGEESGSWSSMMDNFIKGRYRTSCLMAKVDWLYKMEIFIKESGLMVVNMEKDFITIQRINRYMTESGNKIEKMDLVLNQLKMDLFM